MCQRKRLDTQGWLQEVQRDPRTLGAIRARIERLLRDPAVARAVACRLDRGDALFVGQGARADAPEPARATSAGERALAPMRDFIRATDGCVPGPVDRARNPSLPGWFGPSVA